MRVAVCIKQVPVTARAKFDHETKTIIREGVPTEVNSFDMLAVQRAVRLIVEIGGEVVVFTMGPPQAREALVQCLAMGANRAVHLTDRAMAGSDTLATARTLALALRREGFEPGTDDWLIFCGRNSNDAETGQVGPEMAELLQVPLVSNTRRLDYHAERRTIVAERVVDEGYEVIECPLPAIVSVSEGIAEESFPSREALEEARSGDSIVEVGASELSPEPSNFGAAGSPTWVAEIRAVESTRRGVVIEEPDPEVAAQSVLEGISEAWGDLPARAMDPMPRHRGNGLGGIWVVAERTPGGIRPASHELLGAAAGLAQRDGLEVSAVLIGDATEVEITKLAAHGAGRVITVEGTHLGHPAGRAAAASLSEAITRLEPYAVLLLSTANGRDLASRVAARLGLGLTGDCVGLEIDGEGRLVQLKPALGGNIVAPILSKTRPYMTTVRPGLLAPMEPDWSAGAEMERIDASPAVDLDFSVLETHAQDDVGGLELEAARTVLAVGMGIGGPENLPAIFELARSIGATVAASRNVTDAGWLPKQVQVGLTGKSISPDLYIAVGIRGDFNHMMGVQRAGVIIGINSNPNPRRAPIHQNADFSIVGDWQVYLPRLVEALKPLVTQRASAQ